MSYDYILRAIEQQRDSKDAQGQSSPLQQFKDSYAQYQRDLAAAGVRPSKEQVYGRPYKA